MSSENVQKNHDFWGHPQKSCPQISNQGDMIPFSLAVMTFVKSKVSLLRMLEALRNIGKEKYCTRNKKLGQYVKICLSRLPGPVRKTWQTTGRDIWGSSNPTLKMGQFRVRQPKICPKWGSSEWNSPNAA